MVQVTRKCHYGIAYNLKGISHQKQNQKNSWRDAHFITKCLAIQTAQYPNDWLIRLIWVKYMGSIHIYIYIALGQRLQ